MNNPIGNSDDTIQAHTQEIHSPIQTWLITGKDQSPSVQGRHQTVGQQRKRIGNPSTGSENKQ